MLWRLPQSVDERLRINSPARAAAGQSVGFEGGWVKNAIPSLGWSQRHVTGASVREPSSISRSHSSPFLSSSISSLSSLSSNSLCVSSASIVSTSSPQVVSQGSITIPSSTPLLSPPLSPEVLPDFSLPTSFTFPLSDGVAQPKPIRQISVDLPVTPDSTPPSPSLLGNAPNFNTSAACSSQERVRQGSFWDTLLPKKEEVAAANKRSEPVVVRSELSGIVWDGVLLDNGSGLLPVSVDEEDRGNGGKILVIGVPDAIGVEIRESVEILMDLASDLLDVGQVIFVLRKASPDLRELLHGLLFIGGSIVDPKGSLPTSSTIAISGGKKRGGLKQKRLETKGSGSEGESTGSEGEGTRIKRWRIDSGAVLVGIEF